MRAQDGSLTCKGGEATLLDGSSLLIGSAGAGAPSRS